MKKLITICHVSEATSGGVRTHLLDLAQRLPRNVFRQVYAVSSKRNENIVRELGALGVEVREIRMERNISPIRDAIAVYRVMRILKEMEVDIVHCHSSKAGVIGRLAALLSGVKVAIYTPHAFSFREDMNGLKRSIFVAIERFMAHFTQKVICVSEGERSLALKFQISDEHKLMVIHNGVDVGKVPAKKYDTSERGVMVGFVGRFDEQKDPMFIVRAFNKLSIAGTRLSMVGDGPLLSNCQRYVQEQGMDDVVTFTGFLLQPMTYMSGMDIVVSSSLWEGFPYVLLEAMALGIPVIASDIVGNRDAVIDEQTGLLYKVGWEGELVECLQRLIADPELRRYMGVNARLAVERDYDIHEMIDKLGVLYRREVARKWR